MVVSDGLAPIWHQAISNHIDGVARLAYTSVLNAMRWLRLVWQPELEPVAVGRLHEDASTAVK